MLDPQLRWWAVVVGGRRGRSARWRRRGGSRSRPGSLDAETHVGSASEVEARDVGGGMPVARLGRQRRR